MPAHKRRPAADAYKVHDQYWADSGGDVQIPVDPFRIASDMGLNVYVAIMGSGESGYLAVDSSGSPAIFLNEDHHERRQRFTCAHELGHFVDQTNREISPKKVWRDERASHGTDVDEIYANRFAASLLMPKDAVVRLVNAGLPMPSLARRFHVSEHAMSLRLTNLGLR